MGDLVDVVCNPKIQCEVRRRIIKRVPSLQPQAGIPQTFLDQLAELDRVAAKNH